jgi:hypothetical protein
LTAQKGGFLLAKEPLEFMHSVESNSANAVAPAQRLPFLRLALLTAAALAIHGYHLGVEDAEIYIPAASKLIHPELFPFGAEFFQAHEHLSLFAPILAWTVRLTHLTTDAAIFLWYIITLFATLVSCWALAAVAFSSLRARWSAVLAATVALSMPAAYTGLLLMDPYLTARSFSTPLINLALAAFLARRPVAAALLTAIVAVIHPQMAVYLLLLLVFLWVMEKPALTMRPAPAAAMAAILPSGFHLAPAQGPYREALYARDFYFIFAWTWYDWMGLIAPLAILGWFWRVRPRGTTPAFARLCLGLIPYGALSMVIAIIISSSHVFDMFMRLQPLRCFHLVTMVFLLFFGGVVGEYAAQISRWIFPALCVGVATLMFFVERSTYPASPHIEWPWVQNTSNAWINTLLWVRHNTPRDAIFAVDSRYFNDPGVDKHGFRAVSRRSELADYFKDGGAVAIFPALADEWKRQTNATYGLNHFTAADFTRLAHEYPVTWALIHGPAPAGMDCPYQRQGYAVCKIPDAPGLSGQPTPVR